MTTKRSVKRNAKSKESQRHYFTTEKGEKLEIREIPALLLMGFTSQAGKPQPPMVDIDAIGGILVEDYDDEDYRVLLAEWESEQINRMLTGLIAFGVVNDPPSDSETVQIWRQLNPRSTKAQLKDIWVRSLLTENDFDPFVEAIMSIGNITEVGLIQAEERFRQNGQRGSGDGDSDTESDEA